MPKKTIIACAFALVFAPGSSLAEPIPTSGLLKITSGSLFFDHANDDSFADGKLFGEGFSWVVNLERASRGSRLSRPRVDPSFSNAALVVGGTLRIGTEELEFPFREPFFRANFLIAAEPQTLPPVEDERSFTVSYPFELSGLLFGEGTDGRSYRYDLVGGGFGNTGYSSQLGRALSTSLGFEPTAPVPEPATLLLLGMGASAIAIRYRHRIR